MPHSARNDRRQSLRLSLRATPEAEVAGKFSLRRVKTRNAAAGHRCAMLRACRVAIMSEPTPAEIVRVALDELLLVVAKAADDLQTFHAAVSRARIAPLPPFPRASVSLTSSIIKNLQTVEEELREVMLALGLPESSSS
jgi:hypothetical protein